MILEQRLTNRTHNFIGSQSSADPNGDYESLVCCGISSDSDVEAAIKNKTMLQMPVSIHCYGIFWREKGSKEDRCHYCRSEKVINVKPLRKKKV